MGKSISITAVDFENAEVLYAQVLKMRKALDKLQEKLLKLLPVSYGSGLWWEKSDKEAIEAIGKGKGKEFEDADKAIKWLNS